jgi:hypothetical protein
MAIACFRLFTLCLPDLMWCISVRTSCCAFFPYFRPPELLDFEPRDEDLLLLGKRHLPMIQTRVSPNRLAQAHIRHAEFNAGLHNMNARSPH